jgi:oxygen-independent coproporphyrinogen-3 oxidase
MLRSLYIHVPFCRVKCAYCGFYSAPLEEGSALRYVTALRKEIQRRVRGDLETVFIGGGTPSVLPAGSISDIMRCIGEHAHIAGGAEVSVEANPESLSRGFTDELIDAGVTRLSVGVQSFDDGLLGLLGRPHTSRQALDALGGVRLSGLDLSMDLMYSIPGQTSHGWARTLDMALDLGPSHISAYELMIEPGTALMEGVRAGELRLPTEGEALDMYNEARAALTSAGYEHYEVSNYSLPGKRSRHNMNYWRRGEYLGLGPGAVSFSGGIRTRNLPDAAGYCDALEQGGMPPSELETPTSREASREYLMLGLRTVEGVGLQEASGFHGLVRLSGAAAVFLDSGMMASGGGRLWLTEKGMPLMNTVLVELFESLGI